MILRPRNGKFSPRRRAVLAIVVALLAATGWMHYIGAAGISGMETRDMDWNGDGTVTWDEILQSFYAVTVKKTQEGNRECSTYAWRSGGQTIRVECRTAFQEDAGAAKKP